MSSLTPDQVALQLDSLPDWQLDDNSLIKTFEFADFGSAMAFMTQVAFYCVELEHYPTWENHLNIISVRIGERGQFDVAGRDVQLAKRMQACFANFN